MPKTADNLAMEYDISRDAADAFALRSQQLYAKALKAGSFGEETCEVAVPVRRGPPKIVSADEHPRPATTMEDLSRLRPLHAGGVTTAGNASGINDGAVALVVGGRDIADKLGWAPQAHIRATAIAGVEPRVMGIGPVPASKRALDRAGLSLQDMDVIEINEAFAAQAVACMKGLGLADDDARVNRQGGAIAIGHPLGASGARLALTALRQLQCTGGKYALVSMCIGVGQGIAMVIERV
jgi:acetyl-CoA C-acetyltransferase